MIKSTAQHGTYKGYAALALAVLIISTAAVLIKGAQNEGATSGGIAFLRLGIATICLIILSFKSICRDVKRCKTDTILRSALAGIFLAIHFLTWIISLEYIPVSKSTFLVTTSPIWVAIIGFLVLKETITRHQFIGISIAMVSAIFILYQEGYNILPISGEERFEGEILATLGAISIAAYLITGRTLRNKIELKTYVFLTYGFATLALAFHLLYHDQNLMQNLSTTAWFYIWCLALGPQLIGHTILNWGLRHFPANIVSMTVLAEPIAASMLAWIILDEIIGPSNFIGFVGILFGIFIVIYSTPPSIFVATKSQGNRKSI